MPCCCSRTPPTASEYSCCRCYPTVYQGPTRWQKPGPMGRNEWANFHSRYQTNVTSAAGTKVSDERLSTLVSGFSLSSEDHDSHMANLRRLSTPRWQRSKYIAPPKEVFTFRPRMTERPCPCPERGRPAKKPKVPCCFQHEDLEAEFWANIRFPVSQRALRAFPTMKTCRLAQPRKKISPYILFEEEVPCRRKMSPRQWRCHLQRLEYLSKPNFRVLAELRRC
ncbi:uncharacterized protein [Drosophila kikkawai]|uniref:Uncharacterized protein n=1 Tax=Drosophila kikkawai TaxID=30033 RepID=A0A6P4JMP9_DROKI|nr:uncharacterized protein LOC108084355 [Drosophila kikkawai]